MTHLLLHIGVKIAFLATVLLTAFAITGYSGVSGHVHHHTSHHSSGGHYHCHSHSYSHRSYSSRHYYSRSGYYDGAANSRFSLGGGVPLMNAVVDQHYHMDQPDVLVNGVWYSNPNGAPLDTKLHTSIMSTRTWSINAGYSVPVVRFGRGSCLAIEGLFNLEGFGWNFGTVYYSSNTSIYDTAYTTVCNFPIGLVYQFGGQVDKQQHFVFSVGAGDAFSFSDTKFVGHSSQSGHRPFVMAEVGVFAGIPMKLRATAYLGSMKLIDKPNGSLYDADVADGNIDGNLDVKMKGSGGVNLSLIFMPGFHNAWYQ